MDYKKHYDLLIAKGKARDRLSGYVEEHHIIPKCLGGTNEKENLVRLTPEEHYVAHQLLIRLYPNNQRLVYAALMMCRNRINNKLYGWIRRRYSKIRSAIMLAGGSPTQDRRWIANENEVILVDKNVADAKIQEGTHIAGKVAKRAKCGHLVRQRCIECENKRALAVVRRRQEAKEMAHSLFEEFKNSECKSLCEFARFKNTSQPRLTMLWKKHVAEYNANKVQGRSFKS